jgi:hypothetical protein
MVSVYMLFMMFLMHSQIVSHVAYNVPIILASLFYPILLFLKTSILLKYISGPIIFKKS